MHLPCTWGMMHVQSKSRAVLRLVQDSPPVSSGTFRTACWCWRGAPQRVQSNDENTARSCIALLWLAVLSPIAAGVLVGDCTTQMLLQMQLFCCVVGLK